jgi:hypothetical protein
MDAAHTRSITDAHSMGDAWGIVKGAFADGLAQIEGYGSAMDKASSHVYIERPGPGHPRLRGQLQGG